MLQADTQELRAAADDTAMLLHCVQGSKFLSKSLSQADTYEQRAAADDPAKVLHSVQGSKLLSKSMLCIRNCAAHSMPNL